MRKLIIARLVPLGLGVAMLTAGCGPSGPPTSKEVQAEKAAVAAESINFSDNAEITNITRRLTLTADPGLLGYVILLNDMGRPVVYTTVEGKLTSSGKRLTNPTSMFKIDCGQYTCDHVGPGPSDEGTWGSSSPYIYFWSTGGQYYQWSGQYLYSDKPFRLREEPLVIDLAERS